MARSITTSALRPPRSHATIHKTPVTPADEAAGATRFYRWHIDPALYDLAPPRVMTLYTVRVSGGPQQTCRHDKDMGDELPVPFSTTAFVSGKTISISCRANSVSRCAQE